MIKPLNTQTVYLYLVGGNTLAASFIWGINTIFLLDAGLSNFEAFLANAFFTLGQVIFEVPTGVIADVYGRRLSYLLGAITLALSTLMYLFMWYAQGPFIGWAVASVLLGLGFTFFSGALEAWLVDALKAEKFSGTLESVFSKGQIIGGVSMLIGSVAGGLLAQYTNLGVPYIFRAAILILNFSTAFFFMHDLGFKPKNSRSPINEVKKTLSSSIKFGFGNPSVRWIMIAAPFTTGVGFYIFYALQPFLLELYGDEKAYGIAGIVAATSAFAQIIGGLTATRIKNLFPTRTFAMLIGILFTGLILIPVALVSSFWVVFALVFIWGVLSAAIMPIRQTYLNGNIPSEQRATVISFDSLMGASGGIFIQPVLGRTADIYSYSTSFVMSSVIQFFALPFVFLANKTKSKTDRIEKIIKS